MKHPIYRPIAIGALLALASLSARAGDYKDASAKPEPRTIIKVSTADHTSLTLAA